MNFLIKLIARHLARRIERGSTTGAIAGALLGVGAGMACAYAIIAAGVLGPDFTVGCYLGLSVPLTILGALLGSAVGPRKSSADARTGIRLTRYNRAAGPLAIAVILVALSVATFVLPNGKAPPDQDSRTELLVAQIAFVIFSMIAAIVAVREIWFVDLGPTIFIRRLLTSRCYSRHDLKIWGFEIRPKEVVQKAFVGELYCLFQFNDGFICRVNVRGEDSQGIVELLSPG